MASSQLKAVHFVHFQPLCPFYSVNKNAPFILFYNEQKVPLPKDRRTPFKNLEMLRCGHNTSRGMIRDCYYRPPNRELNNDKIVASNWFKTSILLVFEV